MNAPGRLAWLALFAFGIALGASEGGRPEESPRIHARRLRVTIESDGVLRLETPDGTRYGLGRVIGVDSRATDTALDRLRGVLLRLDLEHDPSGHATATLLVAAADSTPFLAAIWAAMVAGSPKLQFRWLAFASLDEAVAPVTWEAKDNPRTFYTPTTLAKIRLWPASPGRPTSEPNAAAVVAGDVSDEGEVLAPVESEGADWRPIEPRREAVRTWVEAARGRAKSGVVVVDLSDADPAVPYGAVLEIFRGIADAGLPFEFMRILKPPR